MSSPPPNIAVLLAAYNGEKYIEEQVLSILKQKRVHIQIFISIDESTDKTTFICEELQRKFTNITIIKKYTERFGSAGKNFYSLFRNLNLNYFDFVALSDQDDIWKEDKLIRGTEILTLNNYEGYSSDVECFWDDGRKNRIIKKSYPQKKYDYFFEPAGPGCTYILKKHLFLDVQRFICNNKELPHHHDWFIYAYARSKNYKWYIDNTPNVLYRQHNANQVGANIGIKQAIKRLQLLRKGIYKNQVQHILSSINIKDTNIRKSVIKNPLLYRRKKTDSLILLFLAIANFI